MSDQHDDGTAQGRCPSCGARVVPTQQWCSLCHVRLGPPATGDAAGPAGPVRQDEEVEQVEEPGLPGLPDAVAQRPTLPPGAAEAMLSELAAHSAARRPLSSGPLAGTSRPVRVALAVGAAVVLTAVGVAVLSLVGLLL